MHFSIKGYYGKSIECLVNCVLESILFPLMMGGSVSELGSNQFLVGVTDVQAKTSVCLSHFKQLPAC